MPNFVHVSSATTQETFMSLMDSEGTRPDRPPESNVHCPMVPFQTSIMLKRDVPDSAKNIRAAAFWRCRLCESLLAGTAAFGLDLSCCFARVYP